MKLANIPRAFGFISLDLQIIEKNTTPPKTMQIFWILNPSTPRKLAVHNRQCNPMIRDARLSIEMKENLRKPGGETKTVFPNAAKRSLRTALLEDSYFCKHL